MPNIELTKKPKSIDLAKLYSERYIEKRTAKTIDSTNHVDPGPKVYSNYKVKRIF